MTTQEYQNRLKEIATRAVQVALPRVVLPAAGKMLANVKNRIITEGKNTAGQKIGDYSTKPAYFTKKQFVRQGSFRGVGQRGFTGERIVSTRTFRAVTQKNGKERIVSERKFKVVKKTPKSMYLESGYKELRSVQGRETSFVNAEYSGQTFLDYQLQVTDTNIILGFTTQRSSRIRKALELKYSPMYGPSRQELANYNTEVRVETEAIIRQLLAP